MRWLLRFFRAADSMPGWLFVLTVVIGIYAAMISALDPKRVDESLAVLLLWQMLSASTGFARPAACGHFDPVLVRFNRRQVAIAHVLHATWPVGALWLVIAVIDAATARGMPLALEPGRLAAFAFVSLACWALGLPAPRFLSGTLWLLAIVAAATTRLGAEQYAGMLARSDGSVGELVHAAAITLACPFLMLGDHVPPREGAAFVLAAAAAAAAGAGMMQLARRDFPLEPSL